MLIPTSVKHSESNTKLFQIEVSDASVHPSEIHQVNVCFARVCVREQFFCSLYALRALEMITPMSVNSSIFKGDDFKLKFQMLHLGMDVLFVIWSMTIGKIVSGHSLDTRFFFLVIFPFIASPFSLSFFWKFANVSHSE